MPELNTEELTPDSGDTGATGADGSGGDAPFFQFGDNTYQTKEDLEAGLKAWQGDYTQKTQEAATTKQQAEAVLQRAITDPQGFIAEVGQAAGLSQSPESPSNTPDPTGYEEDDSDPLVQLRKAQERLAKVEQGQEKERQARQQQQRTQEQQRLVEQLHGQVQALLQKYPHANQYELVALLAQPGVTPDRADAIAKGLHERTEGAYTERKQQEIEEAKKRRLAAVEGGAGASPATGDKEPKTIEEASAAALAALEALEED